MAENPIDSVAAHNLPEYTVSEISRAIKRTLEDSYGNVRIRGEISGFKRAASGHMYFALKDEQAVLDAVCWRGTAGRLSVTPEDGLEVIATGRISSYPGRSRYQVIVEALEVAGEGALLKLLEDRRKKLAAEGLFDEARKQSLPFLPEIVGVVTSPTGAVIRDILHRLADRFPRHVLLWPVLVQGDGAAEQIAAAISGFNALPDDGAVRRPDVLIVARGGGSLEDLWAFNEEVVVRAAAASTIPLISAVGHETDTTLIDFAADRRAPTPTAAAEIAVPVRAELSAQVLDDARRMVGAVARLLEDRRLRVAGLARGLPRPDVLLDTARQGLDDRGERLGRALSGVLADRGHRLERLPQLGHTLGVLVAAKRAAFGAAAGRHRDGPLRQEINRGGVRLSELSARADRGAKAAVDAGRNRLAAATELLNSYSYQRVLERGFVLVRDDTGRPVLSAASARPGMAVDLRFHDGAAPAVIAGGPTKPSRKRSPRKADQGSLL
ncbi:MAG: exodeoxyribonuclease VII large subunit [Alphaproteobacteria bacterium]|nr:exodeoxyribonuclease VII large subunit [Alphaproteobacteria bacterium]